MTLKEEIAECEQKAATRREQARLYRNAAEESGKEADAAEGRLAELRKQLEANRTVGERAAEELVNLCPNHNCCDGVLIGETFGGKAWGVVSSTRGTKVTPELLVHIRSVFAAAINKAVADEREACAQMLDAHATSLSPGRPATHLTWEGVARYYRYRAEEIRARGNA